MVVNNWYIIMVGREGGEGGRREGGEGMRGKGGGEKEEGKGRRGGGDFNIQGELTLLRCSEKGEGLVSFITNRE